MQIEESVKIWGLCNLREWLKVELLKFGVIQFQREYLYDHVSYILKNKVRKNVFQSQYNLPSKPP